MLHKYSTADIHLKEEGGGEEEDDGDGDEEDGEEAVRALGVGRPER